MHYTELAFVWMGSSLLRRQFTCQIALCLPHAVYGLAVTSGLVPVE